MPEYMTARQAASYTNRCLETVRRLARKGVIGNKPPQSKSWVFTQEELDSFMRGKNDAR